MQDKHPTMYFSLRISLKILLRLLETRLITNTRSAVTEEALSYGVIVLSTFRVDTMKLGSRYYYWSLRFPLHKLLVW